MNDERVQEYTECFLGNLSLFTVVKRKRLLAANQANVQKNLYVIFSLIPMGFPRSTSI